MLESSLQSSKAVVESIEQLLQQASNSNSQGGQGKPQNRDQQQDQQQQGKPDDRDGQSPDHVDQGQDQRGKDNPENPDQDPLKGRNVGPRDKRDDGTEKVDRERAESSWGKLPPYLQRLFQKGGGPKVPDKYRSFYEEFLRNADRKRDR
ncbi:MAG: hypothetical protein R3F30_08585 [Planctomycetota bacterium]